METKEKNEEQKNKEQVCQNKTEVYSRVVGFYRPVEQWNEGKKEEFRERKTFKVEVK